MIGAIVGDVIGFPWERHPTKAYHFALYPSHTKATFSDDTVLTLATANAILTGTGFQDNYRVFGLRHFGRGFGKQFKGWLLSKTPAPYGSYGNGSAMRVSPVGTFYNSVSEVLERAEESAAVTHNSEDGIKGAMCVAHAVFLARKTKDKAAIKSILQQYYDFSSSYASIQPEYGFNVTCAGSVPHAITCFLEGESYMDCIRKAVALGGDSDTQASIAGAIAEAYGYVVPNELTEYALGELPTNFTRILLQWNGQTGRCNNELGRTDCIHGPCHFGLVGVVGCV